MLEVESEGGRVMRKCGSHSRKQNIREMKGSNRRQAE